MFKRTTTTWTTQNFVGKKKPNRHIFYSFWHKHLFCLGSKDTVGVLVQ